MLGSGTHGSTLDRPSNMLADYVTQLKIVDGQGESEYLRRLLDAASEQQLCLFWRSG
ncbi:hypothetical protein OH492_14770 [Vibrio chagasii]|nr:hypothetical protein [Vibrio chagasii]